VIEATNDYSRRWFDAFAITIDPAQTSREADWIARVAPPTEFPRLLDLCCGTGRHAAALIERGFEYVGVDRDAYAIGIARRSCPAGTFVEADVLKVCDVVTGPFDVVTILWQSFGYFDAASNRTVLESARSILRQGGRLVLDVYDARFFASRLAPRDFTLGSGESVRESKTLSNGRLTVTLDYATGGRDRFDWQVFTPDELADFAREARLDEVSRCAGFDESLVPHGANPRMQLVFETSSVSER
jgi:SAM-dependent methyltransferase